MIKYKYPAVLSIAGSDGGGGAGIQADLKTFSALGCYGTTAITAVTVQNTLGVSSIHVVPVDIVIGQIKAVMDDIRPVAIKIGMIYSAELATAIALLLKDYQQVPVIFDPVMVSSSGHQLTDHDIFEHLKRAIFPLVQLLTPNLNEAALITDMPVETVDDMKKAAASLIDLGCKAVLIKGGHLQGADLYDVYLDNKEMEHIFASKAIESNNTHGTGCTLSSAITAFLALGNDMLTAIDKAKTYVHQAIEHGKDVQTGEGHGPLNHFFKPQKLVKIML